MLPELLLKYTLVTAADIKKNFPAGVDPYTFKVIAVFASLFNLMVMFWSYSITKNLAPFTGAKVFSSSSAAFAKSKTEWSNSVISGIEIFQRYAVFNNLCRI